MCACDSVNRGEMLEKLPNESRKRRSEKKALWLHVASFFYILFCYSVRRAAAIRHYKIVKKFIRLKLVGCVSLSTLDFVLSETYKKKKFIREAKSSWFIKKNIFFLWNFWFIKKEEEENKAEFQIRFLMRNTV